MKKHYDDDDGRVIADMTDVRKRNLFLPHTLNSRQKDAYPASSGRERPVDDPLSGDEGRWYIFGALRAAVLIWLVYAVVFGVFILGLVLWFRH